MFALGNGQTWLEQLASYLRVGWEGMGWDGEELSVKRLPRSRAPLLCTANW